MRNNPVAPAVVAAAITACALESELLNSERIGERFGNYGIEVLHSGTAVRRSSLYSVEDGVQTCRTYAVVQFAEHEDPDIAAAHRQILAGQSIGATFKAGGWVIEKRTLYIGELPLPDSQHLIARLMHLDRATSLAMHVYRLTLDKGPVSVQYATIIETHHPEYLSISELARLYDRNGGSEMGVEEVELLVDLVLDKH